MTTPEFYIGVGASAGGLEAIESFFKNMPSDSNLAFIVVQHLSPDYKSLMVELLSKKTEMQVLRAEDGMDVLPNCIYLIPPKKNLTIFHGSLILNEQDHSKGINLPIDVFLRSLAEDQGEKAVAIILSGTGSDGMRGIRAIKEHGGMTMVQDEESAKFDGMPRAAISTGLTDFILAPQHMPKQLLSFMKHPRIFVNDEDALLSDKHGLHKIFALIKNRTKVDFTFYKPSTVNRRIERRMTINQIESLDDYVDYLQRYPGEITALHKELLIGVTSFFRDSESFEYIQTDCLPNILEDVTDREVRFWVAGCSTGEEAYSLAIQAHEYASTMGFRKNIKIFATDIDKDAIQYAANGSYPESIAADIDPSLLSKYFHRNNEEFQISRMIREMVVFAQHNLIRDPPFTNIDLISCRNLLIYLQPPVQKKALECFNFSLNPGGYLFLGSSETTGDLSNLFETMHHKHKVFRSKGIRKPLANDGKLFDPLSTRNKLHYKYAPAKNTLVISAEERLFERFLQSIVGEFFPIAVIVDEQMEAIHSFGETEGYFKMAIGRASNDVSKMARHDLAIPLSTGIQKAFKTGKEQEYKIKLQHTDRHSILRMLIKPLPQRKGLESLVAVFLQEIEAQPKTERDDPVLYDLNKEAEDRIRDLEHDLQFTKENLQATIEELETSNEELQATNEELLASNEELQSTNEELQSTNEELHTVNAEHQSRIFELTELHNDIDNILTSTRVGILLLDENMAIRRFSPQIQEMFTILDQDIGRPFTHLSHNLCNVALTELVAQVQRENTTIERDVRTNDDTWFFMRIIPYAIGPKSYSGVVITFIDITQVKQTQNQLAERESQLRETAHLAHVGSWKYFPGEDCMAWSDEVFDIFNIPSRECLSRDDVLEYFVPPFQQTVRHAFENALSQDEAIDVLAKIRTPGGVDKWLKILGGKEHSLEGAVTLSGALQDVSEYKSVERALMDSLQSTADIIQYSPSGMFLYTLDQGELWLMDGNQEAATLTGKKLEDCIGKSFSELWPKAKELGVTDQFLKVLETGETLYLNSLDYQDETLQGVFHIVAFPMAKKRLTVIFERETPPAALERSWKDAVKRHTHLLETLTLGVVYQDASGEIIEANAAAERILGLTVDEMMGRKSVDPRWKAIHKNGEPFPGEEHPSMVALREGREVQNVLMGVFHPVKDETRWISVNAIPIFRRGESAPYQVLATFNDVTELIRHEDSSPENN